jgi:hypothetical protein
MVVYVRKKQYMINSTYRLNANLAVLRRKTKKANGKIIAEVFNPLTNILANATGSNYYVIV